MYSNVLARYIVLSVATSIWVCAGLYNKNQKKVIYTFGKSDVIFITPFANFIIVSNKFFKFGISWCIAVFILKLALM